MWPGPLVVPEKCVGDEGTREYDGYMHQTMWLSDVDLEHIRSMRDGSHDFFIHGPEGTRQLVRLRVRAHSATRSMQFDLWPCGWDVGTSAEVKEFCEDNATYWLGRKLPRGVISMPHTGGACGFTFSVLKEDAPEWIVRAAKILANRGNLVEHPGLLAQQFA